MNLYVLTFKEDFNWGKELFKQIEEDLNKFKSKQF